MTIKELRTQTGMSQQKFSDYLNIPKRTIEDWERDLHIPPVYVVELIEYKLRNENLINEKGQG